ncbi:MAG: outer membrane protein assembly factor BamC [Colwellia sp.]|nr:outer membrane protein assembly factor BamC [Colwellia sp.]
MSRKLFYFSLLSLSISACSGVNNKQAMGGFEYANKSEAKILAIPEGLDKPAQHKDYYVNNDINHEGPVGNKVDIRAPSLVLPIASSSRVEQDSSAAKIWFDQVLEDKDLQLFIYQSVEKQLTSDGVNLNVVDDDKKIFESEWFHNTIESGWLFKSEEISKSMRFQFSFETKPHGRSVALTVNLVEYKDVDGSSSMDLIDKHRAEMAMLNQIIGQVDYQYRLQQRENRLMRANQQLVSIGDNPEAEPAYIVEMELEPLWSNMPIFFEDYGFSITDLNESKKIYYVDFIKPDSSFWDRIWGDDAPVVNIKESSYQFVLAKMDEQTSVTIYDADGNVLSHDTLEKIMPVMEPGLSFRNVF